MKHTRKLGIFLIIFIAVSSPLLAINWLDERAIYPYNENLSLASDLTLGLTMSAPASFLFASPASDWVETGLSYGVTSLASYSMRTVLKNTISRQRPYLLPDNDATQPADTSDSNQSFPSGHTLMAFSSAAYTQTVFSLNYPDSPYKRAVTAATWALAVTTAVLRVASGNHFVTDVLAGAAIGSVLGFAGPYLTRLVFKDKENAPTLMIGPTVGMQVSL